MKISGSWSTKKPHERSSVKLANDFLLYTMNEELFTFVLEFGLEPRNNTTGCLQWNSAKDRKVARTSKVTGESITAA